MRPCVVHELDEVLSQNLVWALQIEEIAKAHEVPIEEMAETFACVRLLLQLRAAGWS